MHTLQELKEMFATRDASDIACEIYGFTGFRTTKIEELTIDEIQRLWTIYAPKVAKIEMEYNALKEELICKEWRSNILALAEKTKMKEKGSFHKFNNWMLLSSKYKKHLGAHSLEELKELQIQLRGVQHNNQRSAHNPMTKAWWEKSNDNKQLN